MVTHVLKEPRTKYHESVLGCVTDKGFVTYVFRFNWRWKKRMAESLKWYRKTILQSERHWICNLHRPI